MSFVFVVERVTERFPATALWFDTNPSITEDPLFRRIASIIPYQYAAPSQVMPAASWACFEVTRLYSEQPQALPMLGFESTRVKLPLFEEGVYILPLMIFFN